jgi:hypothetical protein
LIPSLFVVLALQKPHSQKESYSSGYADPTVDGTHHQQVRVPRPPERSGPVKPSYNYPLDKELMKIEEDLSVPNHLGFPEPNLRRLEQLERMLETMDRMDPATQHYEYQNMAPPPQPPHRLHPMDQRVPVQLDREGRSWMYSQEQRGQAQHPTPQQLAAARQHQMLTNARGSANNWAVEMEQRRLMELRQMQLAKEKEMYGGSGGHTIPPHQGFKGSHPAKPNISLLPTAVMRHMHTNKPGQSVSHHAWY